MSVLDDLMARRPEVPFEAELPPQKIEEFRTRGFVQVPRITSDEELEWLRLVYDALFTEKRGSFRGGYFDLTRRYESEGEDLLPQIIAPEARFPQLKETAFWKNGEKLARQLLGIEAGNQIGGWGHMIRKPARIGESLPWHQDEAYWDPAFDYVALGCWMPLDKATIESGCMSMIPGSHLGDILPHRHLNDDPERPRHRDVARSGRHRTRRYAAHAGGRRGAASPAHAAHVGPERQRSRPPRLCQRVASAAGSTSTPYERPWQAEGKEEFAKHFGAKSADRM